MSKNRFIVESSFEPAGDQVAAIATLSENFKKGNKHQTLLGVTGSGKTFTAAKVIEKIQKPTLVLAHNKTLAAQLYSEFKDFFPKNSVEYFVSYYDYYQPEAYIPSTDTYIEKDSSINDEIDKLRHSATRALFERKDVIIVASVSCIYGLGSPESYLEMMLTFKKGQQIRRDDCLRQLIEINYDRNDIDFHRGCFRVRGDSVDVFPAYESRRAIRLEFFGSEIEDIFELDPISGARTDQLEKVCLYPASHYVTPLDQKKVAIGQIREELRMRLNELKFLEKSAEAQRLESRTLFDLEMMEEIGYCPGVENYSRHLSGRNAGDAPPTLLEYLPKDWLLIVDESHVTISQVGAMYRGDRSRKMSLVEHGFRLPSALDNRPLKFSEFEALTSKVLYVSATPNEYEIEKSSGEIVEQIIRPTGLLDPTIEVLPAKDQVQVLLGLIRDRTGDGDRVLVTTLTKKMSEDLTDYLREQGVKVKYLHSDIDTLERVEILRALRAGKFDVLVGINLLREGLDLPEVSLVAILDADKEGFLRSRTSLIQTFGRAARNSKGHVVLFADRMTKSMNLAIEETNRRRSLQEAYNLEHGITPQTITSREKSEINDRLDYDDLLEDIAPNLDKKMDFKSLKDLKDRMESVEKEMRQSAKDLEFEKAAELRDKLLELRKIELLWKN